MKKKIEYGKLLLVMDYLMMIVLIYLTVKYPNIDFITLDVAWIAQIGVSSGFYYWKSRSENRVKVPVAVIKSLPNSMKHDLDLNQIITTIIQAE